jgi:glutathione synthase/RimK-type ligase-like ATP-grasp enzyme
MKLVLANNQSDKFVSFYDELEQKQPGLLEYAGYDSLLFMFDSNASPAISVKSVATRKSLHEYDGVYLNGYLNTYELAATTATCCQTLGIPFVNKELTDAPSLSKLSGYAKLADKGVRIPRTIAGAKAALAQATDEIVQLIFPLVLKRADADRGIDNYKVTSPDEINDLLADHKPRSLWILQEYVENDGFYLVSFYDQKPVFGIFRTLEARPDGNEQKAHMFKPKGGANASLLKVQEVPQPVIETCQRAIDAMNRQIGSVDCLYDKKTGLTHVLEVNYNPQLVTIETFKDERVQAFIDGISQIH